MLKMKTIELLGVGLYLFLALWLKSTSGIEPTVGDESAKPLLHEDMEESQKGLMDQNKKMKDEIPLTFASQDQIGSTNTTNEDIKIFLEHYFANVMSKGNEISSTEDENFGTGNRNEGDPISARTGRSHNSFGFHRFPNQFSKKLPLIHSLTRNYHPKNNYNPIKTIHPSVFSNNFDELISSEPQFRKEIKFLKNWHDRFGKLFALNATQPSSVYDENLQSKYRPTEDTNFFSFNFDNFSSLHNYNIKINKNTFTEDSVLQTPETLGEYNMTLEGNYDSNDFQNTPKYTTDISLQPIKPSKPDIFSGIAPTEGFSPVTTRKTNTNRTSFTPSQSFNDDYSDKFNTEKSFDYNMAENYFHIYSPKNKKIIPLSTEPTTDRMFFESSENSNEDYNDQIDLKHSTYYYEPENYDHIDSPDNTGGFIRISADPAPIDTRFVTSSKEINRDYSNKHILQHYYNYNVPENHDHIQSWENSEGVIATGTGFNEIEPTGIHDNFDGGSAIQDHHFSPTNNYYNFPYVRQEGELEQTTYHTLSENDHDQNNVHQNMPNTHLSSFGNNLQTISSPKVYSKEFLHASTPLKIFDNRYYAANYLQDPNKYYQYYYHPLRKSYNKLKTQSSGNDYLALSGLALVGALVGYALVNSASPLLLSRTEVNPMKVVVKGARNGLNKLVMALDEYEDNLVTHEKINKEQKKDTLISINDEKRKKLTDLYNLKIKENNRNLTIIFNEFFRKMTAALKERGFGILPFSTRNITNISNNHTKHYISENIATKNSSLDLFIKEVSTQLENRLREEHKSTKNDKLTFLLEDDGDTEIENTVKREALSKKKSVIDILNNNYSSTIAPILHTGKIDTKNSSTHLNTNSMLEENMENIIAAPLVSPFYLTPKNITNKVRDKKRTNKHLKRVVINNEEKWITYDQYAQHKRLISQPTQKTGLLRKTFTLSTDKSLQDERNRQKTLRIFLNSPTRRVIINNEEKIIRKYNFPSKEERRPRLTDSKRSLFDNPSLTDGFIINNQMHIGLVPPL